MRTPRVSMLAVVLCLLVVSGTRLAAAQGVSVTPDGGGTSAPANSSGNSAVFSVQNQGDPDYLTLSCAYSGQVTACAVSGTNPIFLGTGASQNVTVTYSTGAAGSGTVTLWAYRLGDDANDNGWFNVTVTAVDATPPTIVLEAPTGDVTVQYPTIQIGWCDNSSLNATSRWIKVNSVTVTGSFDYVAGSGPASCTAVKARSTSTTVSLNLGSNTIQGYICDNAGNCTTSALWTVNRVQQGAPTVVVKNQNGTNVDRAQCLITGAGEAAAAQCGDLLVAHAMPTYRTLGRDRELTLLYHSATAAIRPTVAVWVTKPASVQQPDSVYAELKINGVKKASSWYTSWAGGGAVRQMVLAYNADADSSGIYPFTVLVRHQYGVTTYDATVNGELMIVNRRNSRFGSGWWLAGVEQLRLGQSTNRILWLGGDGSAAIYDSVAVGVWRRALGAFRDTLTRSGAIYTRKLQHQVTVTFNASGRHTLTTDRVGHVTTFTYGGDTLKTIVVPPAGVSATTYTLAYASGKLDKITDPAGRVLDATVGTGTAGNLTALKDPDNVTTSFAYSSNRLTSRTNRRAYVSTYVYGNSLRVTRIRTPLSSSSDTAVTVLTNWDERGLAIDNPTGKKTPVDTVLSYTQINGPRTDVSDTANFWVDKWGAPVKIRDPLGNVTLVERTDATNPALVTRIKYANGRVVKATYNTRGNVATVTDSTHEGTGATVQATTTYIYGSTIAPDSPTEIRTPPSDTTRITYHATLGLPDTVKAPGGHKTKFTYFTTPASKNGLLQSVRELSLLVVDTTAWTKSAQTVETQFLYDQWGNDSIVTSPKGLLTRFEWDSYRRVIRVFDPMNHKQEFAYDLLNRMIADTVWDGATKFVTKYFYSATGQMDSIADPRNVKRRWIFDAGDRPMQLKDEQNVIENRYFGKSGLLDSVKSRTGHVVRHRYDAAGRLTATIYPVFANTFGGQSGENHDIPGDSIARAYDGVGQLTSVSATGSAITRTYHKEGTLKTERQLTRNWDNTVVSDFTARWWYDAGNRRTKFYNGTDTLRYTYGANGLVATISVQWMTGQPRDSFVFRWDGLGRRDSVRYVQPGVYISFGYDKDGHLRLAYSRHGGSTAVNDHLDHRLWYKNLNADGNVVTLDHWAGGTTNPACGSIPSGAVAGPLAGSFEYDARHQATRDGIYRYTYDASGNRLSKRSLSNNLLDSLLYLSATSNRLHKTFDATPTLVKTYTDLANGARRLEEPPSANGNWRLYYYNALGQMRGQRQYVWNGAVLQWIGTRDRCRYDALGRRVLGCGETLAGWFGFDGDNVIRSMGGYTNPLWRWANGPGLDDPLVALWQYGNGSYAKQYYLTDGRGRHLAFTDSLGNNEMDAPVYYQNGGNQSGTIEASTNFDNSRGEVASAPGLSFYRNRYYDQATGRFSTEDPIDVAGGINLYAYSGNNPVRFTDPFGLCPDSVRTDDGKCPGDLSEQEFNAVENAANEHLTKIARRRIIDALYAGRIRGGNLGGDIGRVNRLRPTIIQLNRSEPVAPGMTISTFDMDPFGLARVLAHEDRHVQQLANFGFWTRLVGGTPGFHRALDEDADDWAEVNVIP